MESVNTPSVRFENLKDYPFEPHFVQVDSCGLLMHYVDEGPAGAPIVLMLHGNPAWSYLYRSMIPRCAKAGLRVIAPDLIGYGKSSKPLRWQDHTYQSHCDWVRRLLEELDLRDVTLFCQDWGSLIGLRLVTQAEERFARVVVANGGLPAGSVLGWGALRKVGVRLAQNFAKCSRWLPLERVMQFGTARHLDADELRAYRAPFPSLRYMAAIRGLPQQLPLTEHSPETAANRVAWSILEHWQKPFLTLFSDGDPVTRGFERPLQSRIPGARGMRHRTMKGGHFLQEDSGPELAEEIIEFVRVGG